MGSRIITMNEAKDPLCNSKIQATLKVKTKFLIDAYLHYSEHYCSCYGIDYQMKGSLAFIPSFYTLNIGPLYIS